MGLEGDSSASSSPFFLVSRASFQRSLTIYGADKDAVKEAKTKLFFFSVSFFLFYNGVSHLYQRMLPAVRLKLKF